MFGKKPDQNSDTATPKTAKLPDPNVRKRSVSVIGPTLKFKGELSANEDLIIEGEIEGSIAHQDKNLTIGKEGRVKANIHASIVEILGRVDGDVRGDEIVRLHKSAIVEGNLYSPRIMMEDGAKFSGSIDMSMKNAKLMHTEKRQDALKRANLSVAETSGQPHTQGS